MNSRHFSGAAIHTHSYIDPTDPPMLITNGSGEIVPLEQAREMAAHLTAAGVPNTLLVVGGSRHAAQYEQAVWAATISFLQRHLNIGYNRAAKLIEQMEKEGIVGPANHVGKREVLARRTGGDYDE